MKILSNYSQEQIKELQDFAKLNDYANYAYFDLLEVDNYSTRLGKVNETKNPEEAYQVTIALINSLGMAINDLNVASNAAMEAGRESLSKTYKKISQDCQNKWRIFYGKSWSDENEKDSGNMEM